MSMRTSGSRTTRTAARAGLAAVAAAGALVGCGGSDGGGATAAGDCTDSYNWRLAGVQAPEHASTEAVQFFADTISERSEGRITVTVFPGGELGSERELIEQVQLGSLDFAHSSVSPMAEFIEPYGVFSLPYVFDDEEHLHRYLEGDAGQEMLNTAQSASLQGLAWFDAGARNFYTSGSPVESPEDLAGRKIRVQESALFIEMMEALGASPTPMSFGEVYSALQTGVVDGAENNLPSYVTTGHFEVADNYTMDEHSLVPELLYANSALFEGLCADDQTLVREVAAETGTFQREQWAADVEEALQTITDAGVQVVEVEDKSAWQEAVAPVIDKYRDQYAQQLEAIEAARQSS